ncbi:hypothetical protein AB8Z38_07255 [Bradyrhizobium sp. LLZ17]|jgi:hypothetical protein|uniref:Integrase n=1 Tax=Bradyrhizobium sp. LLZ17 TaxID=3239388 RepID=A0AB39XQT5_9BRAD
MSEHAELKKAVAPSLPLRKQAAMTFLRARKLPPGSYRDDLRQLAFGLFRMHKHGLRESAQYRGDIAIN